MTNVLPYAVVMRIGDQFAGSWDYEFDADGEIPGCAMWINGGLLNGCDAVELRNKSVLDWQNAERALVTRLDPFAVGNWAGQLKAWNQVADNAGGIHIMSAEDRMPMLKEMDRIEKEIKEALRALAADIAEYESGPSALDPGEAMLCI